MEVSSNLLSSAPAGVVHRRLGNPPARRDRCTGVRSVVVPRRNRSLLRRRFRLSRRGSWSFLCGTMSMLSKAASHEHRSPIQFIEAQSAAQIVQARELFLEYAQSLGFSLCFQNFAQELAGLPGTYAPPDGRLLLVQYTTQLAGGLALHELAAGICEMK